MAVATSVPWVALGSVGAGGAALALVAYLSRYRQKPGANWFRLSLSMQALFCLTYGTALVVFDPTVRFALEVLSLLWINWVGLPFLAFALAYTGRGHLIRTWAFGLFALIPAVTTVLTVTIPYHDLLWTGFEVVPAFGLAGVDYTLQPWAYFAVTVGFVSTGVGVLLLVDTILSYGPLYRSEALAVAVSTLPPAFGTTVWLFEVGPAPTINFAAVLFLPHVALDAYAFTRTGMFESNPTARRAAEQDALGNLPDPVMVLDPEYRIVDLNDAARELASTPDPVGSPVTAVIDADLGLGSDDGPRCVSLRSPRKREFSVSVSPLLDPLGSEVGYTVVLQDITRERERQQRLQVLNRVVRHNLRNEMTVISGFSEGIQDATDRDDIEEWAGRIAESGARLTAIGEKARDFQRLRESDPTFEPVDVATLFTDLRAEFRDRYPDATVETTVETDRPIRSDSTFLRTALGNLVENAIEHTDTARVRLSAEDAAPDDAIVISVRDDGPGIPEGELGPITRGEEGSLDHGSGIGLWIVEWVVTAVGGDVEFDTDDGTTVSLRLPTDGDAAAGGAS